MITRSARQHPSIYASAHINTNTHTPANSTLVINEQWKPGTATGELTLNAFVLKENSKSL